MNINDAVERTWIRLEARIALQDKLEKLLPPEHRDLVADLVTATIDYCEADEDRRRINALNAKGA